MLGCKFAELRYMYMQSWELTVERTYWSRVDVTIQAEFPKSLWSPVCKESTFVEHGHVGVADGDLNFVSLVSPIYESARPVAQTNLSSWLVPPFAWIIAHIHMNWLLYPSLFFLSRFYLFERDKEKKSGRKG